MAATFWYRTESGFSVSIRGRRFRGPNPRLTLITCVAAALLSASTYPGFSGASPKALTAGGPDMTHCGTGPVSHRIASVLFSDAGAGWLNAAVTTGASWG